MCVVKCAPAYRFLIEHISPEQKSKVMRDWCHELTKQSRLKLNERPENANASKCIFGPSRFAWAFLPVNQNQYARSIKILWLRSCKFDKLMRETDIERSVYFISSIKVEMKWKAAIKFKAVDSFESSNNLKNLFWSGEASTIEEAVGRSTTREHLFIFSELEMIWIW